MSAYDKYLNDEDKWNLDGESGSGLGTDTAREKMTAKSSPMTMAASATLGVISDISKQRKLEAQNRADNINKQRSKLVTALTHYGTGIGSVGMA